MTEAAGAATVSPVTDVSPQTDSPSQTPSETTESQSQPPSFKGTKHKLKIDDVEEEVDYDELVARAQKAKGSEKRFDELAKEREKIAREKKEFDEIRKRISEGDLQALIELAGYDNAINIAENLTWNKIQWDDLSEEERERIILREENNRLKADKDKIKADEDSRIKSAKDAQANAVIQREIEQLGESLRTEGLSEQDVLHIQEKAVDEMIAYLDYLDELTEAKLPLPSKLLSLPDVAKKIQSQMGESLGQSLGKLSVEQLRSKLTKEQLAALRQLDLDDLAPIHDRTKPQNSKAEKLFEDEPKKTSKAARRMSTDEAFDRLDKLYD